MSIRIRVALFVSFIAAIVLVGLLGSAEAAPKNRRHQTITCNDRGCSDWQGGSRISDGRGGKTYAVSSPAFGGGAVSKARRYIGMNARQIGLHRTTLWCSAFLRYVVGSPPGVDDRAMSWLSQPRTTARIGAIAVVQSRRKHVGVVSGFDANGNPILISGNHNNRVVEAAYPRRSVIAYVQP